MLWCMLSISVCALTATWAYIYVVNKFSTTDGKSKREKPLITTQESHLIPTVLSILAATFSHACHLFGFITLDQCLTFCVHRLISPQISWFALCNSALPRSNVKIVLTWRGDPSRQYENFSRRAQERGVLTTMIGVLESAVCLAARGRRNLS